MDDGQGDLTVCHHDAVPDRGFWHGGAPPRRCRDGGTFHLAEHRCMSRAVFWVAHAISRLRAEMGAIRDSVSLASRRLVP